MSTKISKIAFVTNNGKSIIGQFGYSNYFMVHSIEDGKVINKELIELDNVYDGSDLEESKKNIVSGLSLNVVFGSSHKYQRHLRYIEDCEAIISRRFCNNGILSVNSANKRPILTRASDFDKMSEEYIDGTIVHHEDRIG